MNSKGILQNSIWCVARIWSEQGQSQLESSKDPIRASDELLYDTGTPTASGRTDLDATPGMLNVC